jgi:hypothetical protein
MIRFDLNPQEILALQNILYEHLGSYHKNVYDHKDPLVGVYQRLNTLIVSSFADKLLQPVNTWLKQEQEKIDKLQGESPSTKLLSSDDKEPWPTQ